MKCKLSLLLLVVFFTLPSIAQTSEDEMRLGIAAFKNNHTDEAIQHFARAAEIDPGNVKCVYVFRHRKRE